MKKRYLVLISIFIILIFVLSKYYDYKNKYAEIKTFNLPYEKCLNEEISGIDLTSIINKAVDDNENNLIDQDSDGKYKKNDENSINIEVKITDLEEDTIIPMEKIYDGGMSRFVSFYEDINFKCAEVKYNSNKKICYMLFEQIA